MRKIKVVLLLVRQLQHGFTKNASVSFDRYVFFGRNTHLAICLIFAEVNAKYRNALCKFVRQNRVWTLTKLLILGIYNYSYIKTYVCVFS